MAIGAEAEVVQLVVPDYGVEEPPLPQQTKEAVTAEAMVLVNPAPPNLPEARLHHRVREMAWHIPWYGFKTQVRLAKESGVSPSTVSRILRGCELPSLFVALRLTQALSKRLGRPLEVREVFSLDGTYARTVCQITGCRSCLPPTSYDPDNNMVPGSPQRASGQWVMSLPRRGGR